MFYLGNRSGLRTGEAAGLRMSDLGFLTEGVVRARFSYDGPLKEDKKGTGKVKWTPAPDDVDAVLGPWLTARQAAGAGPEDLVFPTKGGICYQTPYIERRWNAIAKKRSLKLTWYQATRHSFVSRNLARGASLDEVSAAVGHSSPVVTRRYYDHFVRRTFSDTLRAGLGITESAEQGKLVRLPPTRAKSPQSSLPRRRAGCL
jgi:integrase